MGQGIQQPTMEQGGSGNPVTDVFKILYEPAAVFERVRVTPSFFFVPFLAICVVQIALFVLNMPFMKVAIQAQMAARGAPAGATPPMGLIVAISLVSLVVVFALILLISGFVLWVLVSVLGSGEAKFLTLLSVASYSAIPAVILVGIVGALVLHVQGPAGITSPQDLQPALGLDLLAPGTKGFVGGLLKGINPFSIWSLVLTAIGVSTTHRLSKGTGYTVAGLQFAIALLIGASLAAIFGGRS